MHKKFVQLIVALIRGYRFLLGPWLGRQCRFYPSCSAYAEEAIQTHSSIRAIYFIVKRLLRCHPFCSGGYDPVPNIKRENHGF